MTKAKKYWKGLAELANDPAIESLKENEFTEKLPVDEFLGDDEKLANSNTSRRDFLKFLGFSTAAATRPSKSPSAIISWMSSESTRLRGGMFRRG